MDIQTPDTVAASKPLSPGLTAHLMEKLVAASPSDKDREISSALFEALAPQDAADAVLAALAIAAAQGAFDSFARAAHPDISDETALRLRGGGIAATRLYAMARQTLRKQQEPAAAAPQRATAAPARATRSHPAPVHEPQDVPASALELEPVEAFQPRDRFGQPIPDWRTELMTPAQCRASLAWPRDPALEAEALAEEEAMIAEQKALEARQAASPDPADPGGVSPPGER